MKLQVSNNERVAMTLIEVLVVIFAIVLLAIFMLPGIDNRPIRAPRINCVNNLKEVTLASWLWAADNNDKFPMQISITNGGTMEDAQEGDALKTFQIMSNQLATPKILYCNSDLDHFCAVSFLSDFSTKNISYFVGIDAESNVPQSILYGDDNFEISGALVKPGLLEVPANASIGWTAARHKFAGNIGFADGSVEQNTSAGLAKHFTNSHTRLAIP